MHEADASNYAQSAELRNVRRPAAMYRPKPDARCKVWGDDTQILQEIAELIRNHYAPHVSQSQLLRSKEGGFHLFVEVYKEGSNR